MMCADLANRLLEYAVGGRVGDHQRGQVVARAASALASQIGEVDVALFVAGDGDDFHAGHDGAGGIGAVGGGGDQADVAVRLAAAAW